MQYPELHMKDVSIRVENPIPTLNMHRNLPVFPDTTCQPVLVRLFSRYAEVIITPKCLTFCATNSILSAMCFAAFQRIMLIHSKAQESHCHFETKHPLMFHFTFMDLNDPNYFTANRLDLDSLSPMKLREFRLCVSKTAFKILKWSHMRMLCKVWLDMRKSKEQNVMFCEPGPVREGKTMK